LSSQTYGMPVACSTIILLMSAQAWLRSGPVGIVVASVMASLISGTSSIDQLTLPCGLIASPLNVGWFKDFADPQSLLEPTFKGDAIKPAGNVNWSLLDNKEINDAMTEATLIPAGPERNQAWADINKMIVEQAVAIPYVWDDNITLWSKDVEGAMNAYFSGPDFSFTTLK